MKVIRENQQIPETIQRVGFDFSWDEKRVWKLDFPVREIDIRELEWHFDIPFWNSNNGFYNLRPIDVLKFPGKYQSEYQRMLESDLSYPIDIMENKGRLTILDGLHRLLKAKNLGCKRVKVRVIFRDSVSKIRI